MTDEKKVQIKYIGKKEFMPDFISGSGKNWEGYGDVQEVTVEQSKKLLVHDDEFAEAAAHDALLVKQEEERAAREEENARAEAEKLKAEQAAAEEIAAKQQEEARLKAEADAKAREEQAKADAEVERVKAEQESAKAAPADGAATVPAAEEIAVMNKLALLDLAAAHAVTVNDAAPVVTLRNQLTAALHPAS